MTDYSYFLCNKGLRIDDTKAGPCCIFMHCAIANLVAKHYLVGRFVLLF